MLIVDLKVGLKKRNCFKYLTLKKINNKNIKTILIRKETPMHKIIKLPELVFEIYKYLKLHKNKIIIIEGASWIFYSFITIIILKIILQNCKIIYISHSVESEIRKKYSNKLIYFVTKFLENLVFKFSNYSTSVSIKEKNKIFKLYKKNTQIYPNAVNIEEKRIKKKYQNFI